jgi:hypothetical protein
MPPPLSEILREKTYSVQSIALSPTPLSSDPSSNNRYEPNPHKMSYSGCNNSYFVNIEITRGTIFLIQGFDYLNYKNLITNLYFIASQNDTTRQIDELAKVLHTIQLNWF